MVKSGSRLPFALWKHVEPLTEIRLTRSISWTIVKTAGGLIRVNKLPSPEDLVRKKTRPAVCLSVWLASRTIGLSMDRVPFECSSLEGRTEAGLQVEHFSTDLEAGKASQILHLPNRCRQVWRQSWVPRFLVEISRPLGTWTTFTDHPESSAIYVHFHWEPLYKVANSLKLATSPLCTLFWKLRN